MVIYRTNEWAGITKQSYYCNEYRQDGDIITQYKCGRIKTFDSDGSYWSTSERKVKTWKKGDPSIPDWLLTYIK